MTSRRLIRIKVLQLLYAFSKKENATLADIEHDLLQSMSKSTDLYYETLLLITELRHKAFLKIDAARNRRFASNIDLNPNTRFIENPVFDILEKRWASAVFPPLKSEKVPKPFPKKAKCS